ncbi:hypothetical protein LSAT2_027888 [Lamellibrachia satsuma]|nr:hypothetical protein LSAT2_027888 [Lamellibrachia satsuma]
MSVVGSVKDSIKSGKKKYLPPPRSQPQAQYSDYTDKIGSMALRAHHMNYSRAILNSNWHQAREAEPKDYDISKHPRRSFSYSTYRRIADITDGTLPMTTYQDLVADRLKRKDYIERPHGIPMIDEDSALRLSLERETGHPLRGATAVIPRHHPEHRKFYHTTTHRNDYFAPYPFLSDNKAHLPDYNLAYRRCMSQFTDPADYRRFGYNTWWDESAHYGNSHLRAQVPVYAQRNPLFPSKIQGAV